MIRTGYRASPRPGPRAKIHVSLYVDFLIQSCFVDDIHVSWMRKKRGCVGGITTLSNTPPGLMNDPVRASASDTARRGCATARIKKSAAASADVDGMVAPCRERAARAFELRAACSIACRASTIPGLAKFCPWGPAGPAPALVVP